MISPTNLESIPLAPGSVLNLQELRLWCAPEVILAVTDLGDEESVLYHAIRQARRSTAKVLIVHVIPGGRTSDPAASPHRTASAELAQRTLERMARKLCWVGISSEPILLRGDAAEEIIVLTKMRSVDRVLLTAWRHRSPLARTVAEEIAPWVGVPVCVVPTAPSPAQSAESRSTRIVLALSLSSDGETSLAFAGRLAQHYQATLTVVHVFPKGEASPVANRTAAAVASRLPTEALREARLLCPVEIVTRTGDPTAELLNIAADLNPDFLLLGVPRSPYPDQAGDGSVAPGIVNQARCPVILLGRRAVQTCTPDLSPSVVLPG